MSESNPNQRIVRPSALHPGAKCYWRGRLLEFVERIPRRGKVAAKNVFRSADLSGLNGPDDRGLIAFSDKQIMTEVEWA